ncbi:DotU family type IV/VI secretion system protein [Myxococcus sp. K38C18041901]|uniref:DotU family type IV/VI secretion system protein n=1 Tax=Myxococcus guangdongensis TaxID=2906760 RepID=UPI0020A72EB0|nr:DotU family type IV/VI secretion system protein [Myxococcus guangdongensis]MCP3064804.1 DotU family type IV/VI secretion system protein [Myxococcus guangdongensis]
MNLELWRCVFTEYRRVLGLLDQWLPAESDGAEGRTEVRVGRVGLQQLQAQLLSSVEGLRAGLGAHHRAEVVEEASRPFIFLVDERVLRRLAEAEQYLWPLLQQRLLGEEGGGDSFYELADQKLDQPGASPLVFELLHFCLTAGFGGRHHGDTAKLREYKQRLAARLVTPEPAPSPAAPHADARPLLYEFPARYYAGACLCVLGLQGLLWWLSR